MNSPITQILVDAHVHIHNKYDISSFLNACLQNFLGVRQQLKLEPPFAYFLLLTESQDVHYFEKLQNNKSCQDFQFTTVEKDKTICATIEENEHLYIVCGRQIVTKEKLEILALGYQGDYPDGQTLYETLQELKKKNCMIVLPWGVGKWFGTRGKIIRETITTWNEGNIFLGDNGNRPKSWPLSSIFAEAAQKRIFNLPGSDPLPLVQHERRAGSFGFMLSADLDRATPFASLYEHLSVASQQPVVYGNLSMCKDFVKNQIYMQINKRL
jgi:hypothetical protein